jgi:hypothetical protein
MLSGPKAQEDTSPSCLGPSAAANSRMVGTPLSCVARLLSINIYIPNSQKGSGVFFRPLPRHFFIPKAGDCGLKKTPDRLAFPVVHSLPLGKVPRLDTALGIDYPVPSILLEKCHSLWERPMRPRDRGQSGIVSRLSCVVCVLVFVGAWAALACGQAPPPGTQVADVIPQGLHLVPTPKVMSLIHTRPGAEYSDETVREDVRRLYETHSFSDIRVETNILPDKRVVVNFWFRELPSVIREIVFKGAAHMSKDDLEQATGLRKGAAQSDCQSSRLPGHRPKISRERSHVGQCRPN